MTSNSLNEYMKRETDGLKHDVGFSGSREEPTKEQREWLLTSLLYITRQEPILRAHHGCCVGSDNYFHNACKTLMQTSGLHQIVMHPPKDTKAEMEYDPWDMQNCVWYPRKSYLDRNKDIAMHSGKLLALPNRWRPPSGRGSGTWRTIDAMIQLKRPVTLCLPDGTVKAYSYHATTWRDRTYLWEGRKK